MVALEYRQVQKTFTNILPGMECYGYERSDSLGLFSLVPSRLKGDLTEGYKNTRGIDRVDRNRHGLFSKVTESINTG